MGFWRYFKEKISGFGFLVLGFVIIAAGALAVLFVKPESGIGLNLESACCFGTVLIIAVGAIVITYGQKIIQKAD